MNKKWVEREDTINYITEHLKILNCDAKFVVNKLNEKDQKIADLEVKLAESEKKVEEYATEITRRNTEQLDMQTRSFLKIRDLDTEILKLKQQLAEKDKLLREKIGSLKTTDFIKLCLDCGFMVDAKDKDNQDKTTFAVEKLEQVQKYVDGRTYLAHYIDQLIAEIKGEKQDE